MKKHRMIAALACCAPLLAGAQTNDNEPKAEGKAIIAIFSDVHTGFGSNNNDRGFTLDRSYLGYQYTLKNGLQFKAVMDVGQSDDVHDYERIAYIKNALVTWKYKNLTLSGGLISTTQFKTQESFWGKRYVMKSFQDEYKFGSSADMGVSLAYDFTPWFSADVILVNTCGFIDRAKGPYMWDATGKQFIDYILSWGPMILGHNNDEVIAAVDEAVSKGLSFGAVTQGETLIAEEVRKLVPSMDQVRLVSSGTEAGMSAIRLARGYTGRNKIIKFEGCYHGHSDSLLVKAGSGMLTFGNPSSAGVPASVTEHTLVLEYNNPQQLEDAFAQWGDDIACVIVEAVAGNMNMVRGNPEFLRTMRELCTKHGAVLIVDEVMTGFRVAQGGAQAFYGIEPDLTMLGKVIGGGMPVAAFGGRREIMQQIAPLGPVYQAGTLSGNPVAVACGLATLKGIQAPGFQDKLSRAADRLVKGLTAAAQENGITFCADSVGGMFGLYFLPSVPHGFADVMKSDTETFNRFFHGMLERGVYFAPSVFEAGFVSIMHTDEVIDATIAAARETFAEIAA